MPYRPEDVWKAVERVRSNSPLVHNITNYVVMNSTANALLAIGASPVMAHAEQEVEEMVNIASALVINIGTLSEQWTKSMFMAARRASARNIPIVFDPVGAGATPYRTRTARQLIEITAPTIIRANASETMAMVAADRQTKGVDSTEASVNALAAARTLNERYGSVVCVSGERDYVVAGGRMAIIENGHALMSRVTGLGCTASSLCGAFAAVVTDDFPAATAYAMAVMGIAGEIAADRAAGPGSMQVQFLDALHGLSREDIESRLKMTVEEY
ncbi:MAG: hydroxyethylthiazole kinase [Syntrophobacterales bacterium]|nr:hydroxyethylthiazole kinase [Syntrophobacterales bacterium]